MPVEIGINLGAIEGYGRAMSQAPQIVLRELAKAYQTIGRFDIDKFRAELPSRLRVRSKSTQYAFSFKSTDPEKATDFSKLFVDEYSRWAASEIFQKGGVIKGKGKMLTLFFDEGRGASGRKRFNAEQLRQAIASGKLRFVPTPRGILIIEPKAQGLTKAGKGRKNARDVIIGMLRRQITEPRKFDFYANAERNDSNHQIILEAAVDTALAEIAATKASR